MVQFTNDEKYLFGKGCTLDDTIRWTASNAKDIIALGFDPEKTYFISDVESMKYGSTFSAYRTS